MDATERFDSERLAELSARVQELHDAGHRLVQIGCLEVNPSAAETKPDESASQAGKEATANGNGTGHHAADGKQLELIYSFDKDYAMTHLRVVIEPGRHVPSVSKIYDMAFLYENEIHDLFGLSFDGISLDFQGTFYQKQVAQPFCSTNGSAPVAP